MRLPTEEAVLASLKKGTVVFLGGAWRTVGGRPRPGFVELTHKKEKSRFVRARTKVRVLSNGKAQ